MVARDVLSKNRTLDGELYVVVTNFICQAMLMELQWIMPVPPFDTGKKTRSRLILVDKLTLPRVAARGILWSLSMRSVDRCCAMSRYPIDGWTYWLVAVHRWDG